MKRCRHDGTCHSCQDVRHADAYHLPSIVEHLSGEDGHAPRVEWGSEGQMDGKHGKRADVEREDDALYAECPVERHGEAERRHRTEGCDECHTLQSAKALQYRSLARCHAKGDDHRCQQSDAPDATLVVLKEDGPQQRRTSDTEECPEQGRPYTPGTHDTNEMGDLVVGAILEQFRHMTNR